MELAKTDLVKMLVNIIYESNHKFNINFGTGFLSFNISNIQNVFDDESYEDGYVDLTLSLSLKNEDWTEGTKLSSLIFSGYLELTDSNVYRNKVWSDDGILADAIPKQIKELLSKEGTNSEEVVINHSQDQGRCALWFVPNENFRLKFDFLVAYDFIKELEKSESRDFLGIGLSSEEIAKIYLEHQQKS